MTEVELDSDFAVMGDATDDDGDDSHEGEESTTDRCVRCGRRTASSVSDRGARST